jgi:hypothetical protein
VPVDEEEVDFSKTLKGSKSKILDNMKKEKQDLREQSGASHLKIDKIKGSPDRLEPEFDEL